MGRYEEAKARRCSEPGPVSRSEGMRKWSGGLMPGGPMGSYCPPPLNTMPGPLLSQQKQRNKKVKTYSAYSVSRSVGYILHKTLLTF